MMGETLRTIALVILLLSAAINLVRRQWGLNVIALALQYVCIFLIIQEVRSPLLASIRLWFIILLLPPVVETAVALFGSAETNRPEPCRPWPDGPHYETPHNELFTLL